MWCFTLFYCHEIVWLEKVTDTLNFVDLLTQRSNNPAYSKLSNRSIQSAYGAWGRLTPKMNLQVQSLKVLASCQVVRHRLDYSTKTWTAPPKTSWCGWSGWRTSSGFNTYNLNLPNLNFPVISRANIMIIQIKYEGVFCPDLKNTYSTHKATLH